MNVTDRWVMTEHAMERCVAIGEIAGAARIDLRVAEVQKLDLT